MRSMQLCGFAMLGLALGIGAASAEDKTFELKLSHWVPPSHPLQKALEDWGSSIEKDSGGTIKYKIYPAQQLGKAFDHYDMARDGIADVTYVSPGYQPGRFPILTPAICRSCWPTPKAAPKLLMSGTANTSARR